MANFSKLNELVSDYYSNNSAATQQVIQRGLELRPNRVNGTFWEDLINLANGNSKPLAELLGVSERSVQSWPSLIEKAVHDVESMGKDIRRSRNIQTGSFNGR